MIQERLEEIRQDATIECATNIAAVSWRSMVVELLAHIDEQDKDDLNNGLMANCNQLRTRCWKAEEDCKRWQQVAIEAKAVLHFVNFLSREQVFYLQPKEIQDNYRKQAAKELNLQMEQMNGQEGRE